MTRNDDPNLLRAQLRQILEIAQIGTWTRELPSGALSLSDEACALLDIPPQLPHTRERFLAQVLPEDRPVLVARIEAAYARGEDSTSRYRVRRADGSLRHFESRVSIIFDAQGKAVRALGTVQAITAKVEAVQWLLKQEDDLAKILRRRRLRNLGARGERDGYLANALLAHAEVKPIGLGARDSLRLEAGLCLYGHDLDPKTSPIEADLAWTIQKRRREAKDFPGAKRILREYELGAAKKRVGVRPNDRAPAREGGEIMKDGKTIGFVTSGGFSPVLNGPISMGYGEAAHSEPGHVVDLMIRAVPRPATIVPLPFVPHKYHRPKKGA